MGRFRAVRRKLQAQSLDLRPWAIHPQAIWWTADSGVTRSDGSCSALGSWTPTGHASFTGGQGDSDGGSAAYLLTSETSPISTVHRVYNSIINNTAGPNVFRITCKAGTTDKVRIVNTTATEGAYFDLGTASYSGEIGDTVPWITPLGSGWYEIGVLSLIVQLSLCQVRLCNSAGNDEFAGAGESMYLYAPEFRQHRASGWTSQVYGGAAGPAMAQAASASQLFVQADATSPGGLSLFGKPCLWIPGSSGLYLASSAASAKSLMNGPLSVSALVCRPGAATTTYVCYGTGTNEIRMLVDADGKPYVNVPDLGYAGYSDIALLADVPSVVTYHADPSTGAWSVDVDGIVTSGTFASGWVPGDTAAVYVSPRAAGIRELVLSPPLSAARRAAMRAGMRQRLAA
jgi:hypothetical protein